MDVNEEERLSYFCKKKSVSIFFISTKLKMFISTFPLFPVTMSAVTIFDQAFDNYEVLRDQTCVCCVSLRA